MLLETEGEPSRAAYLFAFSLAKTFVLCWRTQEMTAPSHRVRRTLPLRRGASVARKSAVRGRAFSSASRAWGVEIMRPYLGALFGGGQLAASVRHVLHAAHQSLGVAAREKFLDFRRIEAPLRVKVGEPAVLFFAFVVHVGAVLGVLAFGPRAQGSGNSARSGQPTRPISRMTSKLNGKSSQ